MKTAHILWISIVAAAVANAAVQAAENAAAEKPAAQLLAELLPGIGAEDPAARSTPQQQWQELCFQAGAPGQDARRQEICRTMAAQIGRDTPAAARVWLLLQLQRLGRDECVDAVAAALDDTDPLVRDAACRALAANPAPRAGAKLRAQLEAATDPPRQVVLANTLGFRAEPDSVPVLARCLQQADPAVTQAAARALGKIATPAAAQALAAAGSAARGAARLQIADAQLRCAERWEREGRPAEAEELYQQLAAADQPPAIRLAALQGQLNMAGPQAAGKILEVLAGQDAGAWQVAIGQVSRLDSQGIAGLADGLPKLSPPAQVELLRALGVRRDPGALPAVRAAATGGDEQLKAAALAALGGVGNADLVPLLREAMQAGGECGAAARRSLETTFAAGVDQKLIELLGATQDAAQQSTLIEILDLRRAAAAAPVLLGLALSEDPNLRRRAMGALGRLAATDHVAGMIQALGKLPEGGEREEAERSIAAVCLRVADPDQQAAAVLAVFRRAAEAEQLALLPVLGRIGGPQALETVRTALAGPDAGRYDSGLRALCNWPDATVAEDLLQIAASAPEPSQRVRAVRAVARVVALRDATPDRQKLELLQAAMQRAARDEDRELILDRAAAIRIVETLRFVLPYLDNPALQKRACRTVVDLAHHRPLRERHQAEFQPALEKVLQVTPDKNLADRARQYLAAP